MINIKNDKAIKDFGKKVRDFRISKGFSQEELANIANIPLSQIGRIERGEINTTISTIHAIGEALQVPASKFFTD